MSNETPEGKFFRRLAVNILITMIIVAAGVISVVLISVGGVYDSDETILCGIGVLMLCLARFIRNE